MLACASLAGDIFIFNSGASTKALAAVYTQAVDASYIMMSESGAVWFAEWIAANGAQATVDSGLTNLIYNAADAAENAAVFRSLTAISASNLVYAAADLLAARQAITASNAIYSVQALNAANLAINSSQVTQSKADLLAAQQAITASNAVFSVQNLTAAKSEMDIKNIAASATDLLKARQAITASNVVYSATYATKTELGNNSTTDKAFATSAVGAHAGIMASEAIAGHVKLGTGLLAASGKVHTLTGSRVTAAAASEIAWDCSTYTSLDIITDLPLTPTHVTLSNLIPGFTYTMTARTGAAAGKISFSAAGGTMRPVSGSMDDLTLPAGKLLLVTVQDVGGGNFIYSTAPVN